MASTFSTLLGIELIGTGDQSGTWGNTTNTNLGTLIEDAIAATANIDVSVGNVTLTSFNGAADQARCMALRVIGSPGVSRNIIAPAKSKMYIISNGSDANVVIKTSTSTGITVPTGEVYLVYYDTISTDFKLVGRAARSTNTANTLVLRDGSGNFAANTITASDFVGNLTGNVAGTHNGATGNLVPNTGAFTTLSSTGNTTLGDTSGDTLTVNATPTFNVAIPVGSGGTGVSTLTGIAKGNGTSAFSAAVAGIDYAPATTGTSAQLIANNGLGGFNNVTLDPSLQYTGGTLSVVSGGGMVYPGAGIPLSTGTSWSTPFNNTSNPIPSSYGGTGLTTFTAANNAIYSTSASALTAGTLPVAAGGTGATSVSGARTSLGATTVGGNFFTLTNPSAVTFIRVNADNTVSTLDAATFRTAIGAGSGTGTVTSVSGAGGYGGLTLTGTVTTSGSLTLGGTPTGTWPINVSGSADSANTATTATNLAGGGAGQVPYNSASGTTAFLAAGSANQVLQSNGTSAPSWVTSVNRATNLSGGGAGQIPYNTGANTTSFVSAGSAGQVLLSNGTSAPAFGSVTNLGTAVNTTATASPIVISSSIPSWAKRITIIFKDINANGSDNLLIQLGTSGGYVTSGYTSVAGQAGVATNGTSSTAGFVIMTDGSGRSFFGTMTLCLLTGTTWVSSHSGGVVGVTRSSTGGGSVDIAGTLTQIQMDWTGTNSFNTGGTVNIMYE